MKPLFLDNPPRYTRTQRQTTNDVDYACPIEQRRSDYSQAWWAAMLIVSVVAVVVVVVTGVAP
jgi:hypothetical protein